MRRVSFALIALSLLAAACKSERPEPTAQSAPQPAAVQEPEPSTAPQAAEEPQLTFRLPPAPSETEPQAPDTASIPMTSEPLPTVPPVAPVLRPLENAQGILQPAEFLEFYQPFYPLPLRVEGIEGEVVLGFTVTKTGEVRDIEAISATAREFIPFALEAARDWRFAPALQNGEPFDAPIRLPVTFLSERGSGEPEPGSFLERVAMLDDVYYLMDPRGRLAPANTEVEPIFRQLPHFPASAMGRTTGGSVTLLFTVTPEGRAADATVTESTAPEFEEAALRAIRYWQFIPRIRDGRAVASQVQLPITFRMDESEG